MFEYNEKQTAEEQHTDGSFSICRPVPARCDGGAARGWLRMPDLRNHGARPHSLIVGGGGVFCENVLSYFSEAGEECWSHVIWYGYETYNMLVCLCVRWIRWIDCWSVPTVETVKNVLAESETSTSTAGVRARPGLGLEGGLVIVVVVCGLDLECHRELKIEIVWLAWEAKASKTHSPYPKILMGEENFDWWPKNRADSKEECPVVGGCSSRKAVLRNFSSHSSLLQSSQAIMIELISRLTSSCNANFCPSIGKGRQGKWGEKSTFPVIWVLSISRITVHYFTLWSGHKCYHQLERWIIQKW